MAVKRVARMKGESDSKRRKNFSALFLFRLPFHGHADMEKNDLLINLTSTARESKGF